MSRGRSRHQASRRRMYSARQRDLRERRLHAAREGDEPLDDDVTAIQIEDASDAEVAVPMSMPLRRGATAA
jgi:hypothetical protein